MSADGRRIHELFEAQVARTPDAVAVVAGGVRLSYGELDGLANGVAGGLVAAGVGRGDLVGVCLGRGRFLVAGLLGVLKAGAGYVPLEPGYPVSRLGFLVGDAGLRVVVTEGVYGSLVGGLGCVPVLADAVESVSVGPGVEGGSSDVAYVVYTSGSTGEPKGVVIEHHMTVNFLRWACSYYRPEELAGSLAALSICFDVSILEIFAPLVSGGTVIVAENLLELPSLPARDEVTMVSGPPSGLRALLHRPLPSSVRTVNAAGEALSNALLESLFNQPGVRRVVNGYGPSEATTLSHCQEFVEAPEPGQGPPPIGRPVGGAEALVLGVDGGLSGEGEVGELWLAGPGVARGYLGRPELTGQRFVVDPGVVGGRRYGTGDLVFRVGDVFHFVGRVDDQVKVRGFRVELGEVEQALVAHPGVHHAVVLAPADEFGSRVLVGYVEPVVGGSVSEGELRGFLLERLPSFLVPGRVVVLDRIPLTPGGKADRGALAGLVVGEPVGGGFVAPVGEVQVRVAEVVAGVLGVSRVGVGDSFFGLGGHSLAAAAVVARLSDEFDTRVPLAWLTSDVTVAELAARLADASATASLPTRLSDQREFPLTGMQWNLWMVPRMFPGATNTIAVQWRLTGLSDGGAVRRALDGIVERHQVLRTIVEERDEMPVAVVRPPAAVPVVEVDLRDVPAAELRERVAALADEAATYRFDLAAEVPLLRAALIWTAPQTAELVVVVDHFAFDGYSIGVFAEELAAGVDAALAGRPDPNPAPPLQVGDVASHAMQLAQQAPPPAALREFWRAELAGANSPNLPGTMRDKGPVHGRRLVRRLGADLTDRLDKLEADCGITRFGTFATALGALLARRTGETDNLIGTLVALRDQPRVDRVIGPLVDMVAIRARAAGDPSFRELAGRVGRTTRQAIAHQDLGIAEIVQCAEPDRDPGLPLTPIVLSMQPATVPVAVAHGAVRLELVGELDPGGAMCDIAVLVNATVAGVEIQLMYDTERFDRDEVEVFAEQLVAVLTAATDDPDRPISTYALPPTPVGSPGAAGVTSPSAR